MESRFSTHYRKLNLPQRCPAVPKYPELLSALSKRNLAQQRSWDGLIEKMRRAGIDVNTNWEEGERVLAQEKINSRLMAVDRSTDEYKQKVSEAEQRIEKRLAELNRSIFEEQSPKSDYGNSDGSMPEDISSVIDGDTVSRAQSVASSGAKVLKNVELSYRSGEKLYIRTKNFQNWFGKWEKNEQLSSKIAVKTAFYNLYRILVQLWLKA